MNRVVTIRVDVFSTIDALRVATLKTGTYTVEGPVAAGRGGGRCDTRSARRAVPLRRPLGEAFQLRDDVLGVYGDTERTGSRSARTCASASARCSSCSRCSAPPTARDALLRRSLGNPDPDLRAAGLAELRGVIPATGALEQVEARIAADCAAARAAPQDADPEAVACAAVDELAVRVTSRDR